MSETSPTKPEERAKDTYKLDWSQGPSVTHHQLGDLKYTVTVGLLPVNDEFGEPEAAMFYTAYTKDGETDPSKRPLMFSFNGGPGSSSVWLHLGAVGPKRVVLAPEGFQPAPPFRLEDNPQTWLHHADLVFIDPVGTGYSRPVKKESEKKFWSLAGDVASVGEFIRLYLSRSERWSSPLYLVGESYGTTRAAGLAGDLIGKGIAFNGLILVSSILNFQTTRFTKGNDLPFELFLPSYTATAWYHGKLPHFPTLAGALKAAEDFVQDSYGKILHEGDRLSAEDHAEAIQKLVELTGLDPEYVDQADLRIQIHRFCKELLRDEKLTVGRLDSRYKGLDANYVGEVPEHDPSNSAILPAYTAGINDLLQRSYGWKTDMPYFVFNPGDLWKSWTYGDAGQGFPDTSESLRAAISKNPHMRVMIASGYYDLATPYFATEYTLAHLGLAPAVRQNISTHFYEAGHMMYVHEECLQKLATDVASFIR
ncbi:MAG: S10 family peptidase [Fimbriimonas sp.]